jgi:hypothetical protein
MSAFAPDVALDALFQRNATTRPDAPALFAGDGTALTYAEAANAVASLAQQIASLGLAPKSMIALHLPNGHESVLALLATMRCGHIPVPMPVAWRKSDLVRACREAETSALITTANYGVESLPQLAADVAIEVFELSFPCAFGSALPDGIIPLTLATEPVETKVMAAPSTGIGTLQPSANGASLVLHTDQELLAAGLGAMLAAEVQSGDNIVSAVSLSSTAGVTSALVPWLLSGGTLRLLADISEVTKTSFDKRTHLVAIEGAIPPIAMMVQKAIASVIAVHFAGTVLNHAFAAVTAGRVVDIYALGEICAIALLREEHNRPQPIPLGAVHAGSASAAAPVIAETMIGDNGNIHMRGASVARSISRDQAWADTGFPARRKENTNFDAEPPAGLIAIGGLRFMLPDLERRIRAAALVSKVEIETDGILGSCLMIASERVAETCQALLDAGLPRVVANAVRKAETARRSA